MKNWIEYTGFEWLLVDLASRYGLDNKLFHTRIEWSKELLPLINMAEDIDTLTKLMAPYIDTADEPPMFAGAVLAIWDTIKGNTSTWQVGQDASSSGPALLSVLLKDITGMRNTGIIGKDVPDLYGTTTKVMNTSGIAYERKIVKKGIIPHVYASEVEPKKVFGKDYPRFLKAYKSVVRKAQEASDFMVAAWNPYATEHSWVLPDGGVAKVPVLVQTKKTLPCGKYSFEYIYNERGSLKKGEQGTKSLSANTTHSYDAYILRELNRRCNYNVKHIKRCMKLLARNTTVDPATVTIKDNDHLLYLENLYFKFNQPSAVAFEYIDEANVHHISSNYAQTLMAIAHAMLSNEPFEISNIHDEFKSLPNYVGYKKRHYNILMVETYLSNWWTETAKDLTGTDVSFMSDAVDLDILPEILNAPYSIG